ncbi:hypothetical protein Tco_1165153, partial [Tanacetum coccineum]
CDMQSEKCKKRLKVAVEKHEDSTEFVITKAKEEAAEALFELHLLQLLHHGHL